MTDEQLMLLEQLTYADKDLFDALGITYTSPSQVLQQIKELSADRIYALSKQKEIKNHTMTGQEWADILFAIRADDDIKNLTCEGYNDKAKACCYVSKTGETYVTFRGTCGPYEWKDDAVGLGVADTECQQWALDYIESLPHDNITVVGHSKGGNKAQYVTLLSDKVNRCVSMDGQGFSKEFLDKYWAEIEQKGHLIKNYSYKSDFVHILMNYVPGAEQIYCEGSNTGKRCHNPNGMIKVEYKDNKWTVSYEKTQGNTDNPAMTYFHGFTCFVANNMPLEDRQKIGEYFGMLLAMALADGEFTVNGKKYNKSNIIDFILSDPDSASTMIAYLMKYIETYNLSKEEAFQLMEMLGITGLKAEAIWWVIDEQDLDGEHDLGYYLNFFRRVKREAIITATDELFLNGILTKAKKKRNKIKINKSTGRHDHTTRTDKKRDFSAESQNVINTAIDSISKSAVDVTSSWNSFAGEEWFGVISADIAMKGIKKYFEKLRSVNSASKLRIDNVHKCVKAQDSAFSAMIKNKAEALTGLAKNIKDIAGNLG